MTTNETMTCGCGAETTTAIDGHPICPSCEAECRTTCQQCGKPEWRDDLVEGLCGTCQDGWDRLLQKAIDEIQMAGTAKQALKALLDAGLVG